MIIGYWWDLVNFFEASPTTLGLNFSDASQGLKENPERQGGAGPLKAARGLPRMAPGVDFPPGLSFSITGS